MKKNERRWPFQVINGTRHNSVIKPTASWNSSNVLSRTVNSNISCQLFCFVSLLQPENSWLLTWNMKETFSFNCTSIRGEEQQNFSGHVYISSYLRVKFVASEINTNNFQTVVVIFSKKKCDVSLNHRQLCIVCLKDDENPFHSST